MTLSDREIRNTVGHFFGGSLLLRSYGLTENDHIWQRDTGGRGVFLRVSHTQFKWDGAPAAPLPNFWDPYLPSYGLI